MVAVRVLSADDIDPRYIRVGDQYFDIEWMILRLTHHG